MKVKRIEHACPDGGEGLLAIILRYSNDDTIAGFVTPPETALQVAEMRRSRGDKVKPHIHNPVKRNIVGTQEVILITSGVVRLTVFASSGLFVESLGLWPNDVAILLRGGHSLEMLADSSFIEVKQGPYAGPDDKRYL